uniref:Putative secreted protein n=1 Tax=Ixodes ricinus TaxID=34613 RepID=A0A6B0U1M8_IXORI
MLRHFGHVTALVAVSTVPPLGSAMRRGICSCMFHALTRLPTFRPNNTRHLPSFERAGQQHCTIAQPSII